MIDTRKIRKDFPILSREINGKPLVYLDSAATSQKPKQVIDAISDFYEKHNSNVHRGVHTLSGEATDMVEEARQKVADFIGAKDVEEIVFVRNASEAINLVVYSWGEKNIQEGDRILVSVLEHHSNIVGWQQLALKKKATLSVVDVDAEGRLKIMDGKARMLDQDGNQGVLIGSLESLLDDKVKLVAISQASNVLGTIVELDEVVKRVVRRAPEAKILVDGSQSVPHMAVDVSRLGADFLVFSGHKMLGPTGIGVLWGRRDLLQEMPPFLFGGDMISEVELGKSVWNRLPWKFEAGTPNMAGMVGLGAAVDYLNVLGMEEVREHERKLTEYALSRFEELEKESPVRLYGFREAGERLGVISFNVDQVHAHDTAQVLDSLGIAVRSGHHCAMPLTERLGTSATVRASFYIYTTKAEIDLLVEGISKVRQIFGV